MTLEAVATRPDQAVTYVKAIRYWREMEEPRYKDVVRVWVEPVWTDHLICMPLVTEEKLDQIAKAWEGLG